MYAKFEPNQHPQWLKKKIYVMWKLFHATVILNMCEALHNIIKKFFVEFKLSSVCVCVWGGGYTDSDF
jgi:hypothetical protein